MDYRFQTLSSYEALENEEIKFKTRMSSKCEAEKKAN